MSEEICRTTRLRTLKEDVDEEDKRTPFQRDRDRILYTRELRRLAGITQVVHADEGHYYHNRLTHSLKVAQVGRRLAEYLQADHDKQTIKAAGGLDEDVVEAAALAHDLGHPPFGHAAEKCLQSKLDDIGLIGGFEGNPQSFRIVNEVAVHSTEYRGLDLTCATLNAILKYPWSRTAIEGRRKWGFYDTEREIFDNVRNLETPGTGSDNKSLESKIMDWADDITYAIHDLIDFYKAGILPLEQIIENRSEREKVVDSFQSELSNTPSNFNPTEFLEKKLRKIGDVAATGEPNPLLSPFNSTPQNIGAVNYLSSQLVERYLGLDQEVEVEIDPDIDGGLNITDVLEAEVALLKYLTKYYVFENPTLLAQQEGQKEIIEEVFELLYDSSKEDSNLTDIIPEPFYTRLQENVHEPSLDADVAQERRGRIIADLIASLSEDQIQRFHERVSGSSTGSITDRLFF